LYREVPNGGGRLDWMNWEPLKTDKTKSNAGGKPCFEHFLGKKKTRAFEGPGGNVKKRGGKDQKPSSPFGWKVQERGKIEKEI